MAVKSVIEIDVLDEKFKAFQAAFEKYKKSVDEQSKKWKEFNKTISEAEKRQKDFNKALQDGGQALKGAVVSTASIASNMASAAVSAAKWMAYSAVAGGFGLGALASSASNLRREATGYGVSTGQLRAARTYGEPYIGGIEGMLGNIQTLQTTLTEQYKVGILGGDLNKNAYQNLIPALQRIREAKTQSGGMIDVAMNTIPGIKDVASQEQVQTIWNMTPEEYKEMMQSLQKGDQRFSIDDANYQAWRKFWTSIVAVGNDIQDKLIVSLSKLTPFLIELTEAVGEAITSFLKSDELKQGLQEFTDYLKSDDGKQALRDFFVAIKMISQAIIWIVGKIPGFVNTLKEGGISARQWISHFSNEYDEKFNHQYDKTLGLGPGEEVVGSKKFIQGVNMNWVDPKLKQSLKELGLNPISGYRSEEYARSQGIWHEGSHHTLLNAQGMASAVDIDPSQIKYLMAKYTDQQLKEQFDMYRQYPNDPKEQNHFERWSTRNESKIYVYVNGELQPMSNMAGQQR